MTYLFNAYALTQLKASSVSTFTYIQPLVGILFALAVGQDQMTEVKALAGAMVVVGVYLATKKQKEPKRSH
jgi:drug/metabolite transporter (DMT)-like permease